MLFHIFIQKTDYSRFSVAVLTIFHDFQTDSKQKCNKIYLEENNKTPIKCNSNYCSNSSLFFTASFPSFGFDKFIGVEIFNRFFLYDDPPYSSYFNSIWIPPKIKSDFQ
ncbi:hypothetical protein C1637_14395 [Chryseobacterium lactis]|uniref:Uncharacterized protein n=1 Tax=Chryseobacterium lactis TaxID=1241981 RepID=A0A3G6RPX9_CHRLC|nr:hypothetical protein EG342_18170 [Chryseobacterium lactis]AZB04074.1 hypothetical protein EG341_09045 [Chryseobacterium lactis]PNW13018.1 hypothetical protein C1637_14395 [Chryseobacterium lactis]